MNSPAGPSLAFGSLRGRRPCGEAPHRSAALLAFTATVGLGLEDLLPPSVRADSEETEETEERVEITAEGDRAIDPSRSTARIDGPRLERARERGEELADLVDEVAGVRVLDLGGPVSDRRITIRGSAPSQALLVVDGAILRAPFATGLDLGLLHPESLERVEILRGGQGASLGEGALAGAVAIETRRPGAGAKGAASATYGSHQTARIGAWGSTESISVSASAETTRGDFAYVSRLFGLPDAREVRDNNDARRGSLALRSVQALGEGMVDLSLAGSFREAGVPGLETQENLHARELRSSAYARSALTFPISDPVTIAVSVSGAHLGIDYDDSRSGFASSTDLVALGTDGVLGLALGAHRLEGAVFAGLDAVASTESSAPPRGRFEGGLSHRVDLAPVTLFGALRAVGAGEGIALLPRAGVRWAVLSPLAIAASLGRSLRLPTADELHHPAVAGLSGNAELVAESAWEAELSAEIALDAAPYTIDLRAAGFGRVIEDTILYLNRDAFLIRPENAGDARALGAELEVAIARTFARLSAEARGNASFLFARLSATGDPLPTQPAWAGFAEATAGSGPLELTSALRAFGPTSTRFTSSPENHVPSYLRWDAGAVFEPFDWASLGIMVQNLLDDRALQSVHKIPLPGRTWFLTLRLSEETG